MNSHTTVKDRGRVLTQKRVGLLPLWINTDPDKMTWYKEAGGSVKDVRGGETNFKHERAPYVAHLNDHNEEERNVGREVDLMDPQHGHAQAQEQHADDQLDGLKEDKAAAKNCYQRHSTVAFLARPSRILKWSPHPQSLWLHLEVGLKLARAQRPRRGHRVLRVALGHRAAFEIGRKQTKVAGQ